MSMNLILVVAIILAVFIGLKLLKKVLKLALFIIGSIILISSVLGFLIIRDFRSMDDEKIIFLAYDQNTTELADRYVIFMSGPAVNLSNSQILKHYWNEEIEVVPETILFKILKILR